ncbi:ArsR family transcriptional regulator [Haladaptatus sp. F3-133]|jgi:predicted transcriptional regulator|uniref:ArsR family transcriptional regulator n=1 Tax=Halorutilus salinus TaxID=2487751 RepID=A0A9Q4C639_9EURY|nr:ArsR family transcriptional regulator [Halorutilus salinus]MCX2819971.1 ArsR family transcriptional regulator [Halorutilus salinus]
MSHLDSHERDEQGRVEPRQSDKEVVDAVRKHEPAATKEVADELDMARQSADYRLRKLKEEKRVRSKMVGNSLVWMVRRSEASRTDTDPTDSRK